MNQGKYIEDYCPHCGERLEIEEKDQGHCDSKWCMTVEYMGDPRDDWGQP